MNTQLITSTVSLTLKRYPLRNNETLQAWDSADEYLIAHLEQLNLPQHSHLLLFNDGFGALSCWAKKHGHQVTSVNDSYVSQQNIDQNLQGNGLDKITHLDPLMSLPQDVDIAIIKLPKTHRLLTWQLKQLAELPLYSSNGKEMTVLAGGKVKHIHTSTLALFEQYLGATKTSLAKKKARLIFCKKEQNSVPLQEQITVFDVPEYQLHLVNYPNVFSAEKLDVAAYLMLKHIPIDPHLSHIIDLGCGNGVLGLHAAKLNPQAKITAVDESAMAIASTKRNFAEHQITNVDCIINDCLSHFEPNSADLILCNPPFHQHDSITDQIAWQMFHDAKRVLKPNGRLMIIGNRHLDYHQKLKRLFHHVHVVAANAKFVVLESHKKLAKEK